MNNNNIISLTWSNEGENLSNCWSNGEKSISFTTVNVKGSDSCYIVILVKYLVGIKHINQYIDGLIVYNNKKFGDYVKEIYPSQLTVENANTSDDLANYPDLTFIIESNNLLYTKLYDKRGDFDFHMVNFPFLSSDIPSSPSYGVYISQLIRYARCSSYYNDFGYCHKLLVDRLLSQGYEVKRLRNSFKNFYGRYPDLIGKYQRSVKDMVAYSFPD